MRNIDKALPSLMANREPTERIPRSLSDGPMVISTETLKRIERDDSEWRRIQGWKWDVLVTLEAAREIFQPKP